MVGTIGVAGCKARERSNLTSWLVRTAGPHLLGSVAGGALLGLTASFLGAAVQVAYDLVPLSLALSLLVFAVGDLTGVRITWVSRAKQVPLSWKHELPVPASAALYGITLGLGLTTTVYYWSFIGAVLGMFVVADISLGVAAGCAFAGGRCFWALAGALASCEKYQRYTDVAERFLNPGRIGARGISAAGLVAGATFILFAS